MVDDSDYAELSKLRWYTIDCKGVSYALVAGSKPITYMHRLIMNAPSETYVDHINRNGLDNRRENLRVTTQSQNIANAKMFSSNTSGFKGVTLMRGKWHAQIKYKKHNACSGNMPDLVTAALVRDELARRLFGEPTFINLPDQTLPNEYKDMVDKLIASVLRRSAKI